MTAEEKDRLICLKIDELDGLNSERSDLLVRLRRVDRQDRLFVHGRRTLTGKIGERILEIDREIITTAEALLHLLKSE